MNCLRITTRIGELAMSDISNSMFLIEGQHDGKATFVFLPDGMNVSDDASDDNMERYSRIGRIFESFSEGFTFAKDHATAREADFDLTVRHVTG